MTSKSLAKGQSYEAQENEENGLYNIAEEGTYDSPNNGKKNEKNGNLMNNKNINDQDIPEYIEILENHRKMCEKTGNYVEAEMAKNRIIELKAQYEHNRREELKSKHLNEKLQIEEAHLAEFNQFNEFWDKKMGEFNEQAQIIEEQMIVKHQQEMAKFLQELENSLPAKPKDSPELLNLRKIQESLAKQKDYIEAHKIQQKCNNLVSESANTVQKRCLQEKAEFEKWQQLRAVKIKNQREQLEVKQANELNALRKKIFTGQDEQRKARSIELERLLQKYQNVKKDLDTQHQLEHLRLGKPGKRNPFTPALSPASGSLFKSQGSKGLNTSTIDYQKTPRPDSAKRGPDSSSGLRKSAQALNSKKA